MLASYCLGLIRSLDRQHLVLIEKQRPAFQKGRLNGIGGKIEAGETPIAAMVRECAEECGLSLPPTAWTPLGRFSDETYFEIWAFSALADLAELQTLTDEPVGRFALPLDPGLNLAPDLDVLIQRLD